MKDYLTPHISVANTIAMNLFNSFTIESNIIMIIAVITCVLTIILITVKTVMITAISKKAVSTETIMVIATIDAFNYCLWIADMCSDINSVKMCTMVVKIFNSKLVRQYFVVWILVY